MREELYENSASPRNEKTQRVAYVVYSTLFVVSVIGFVVFLFGFLIFGDSGMIWLTGTSAIFGVLLYLIRRRLLTYFDYTFISGELRIVRVINGKSRKKFLVIDCKDVFLMGKVGSESFEKLYATPGIKKKMATPNGFGAEKQLYYIGANVQGEKAMIIMECEEQMLSYIATYAGRNTIEKDYGKEQ